MDTVMLIGRLLVSLAAVLGVMWVIARRFRKGPGAKNGRVIEVLDRTALTRSSSVAVVRVGDKALVLGVADAQVSVLGETDLGAAQAARATTAVAGRRAARPRLAGVPAAAFTAVPVPPIVPVSPIVPVPPATPVAVAPAPVAAVTAAPADPSAGVTPPVAAGPLAGSALSPQTWRQTLDSLRDLTART